MNSQHKVKNHRSDERIKAREREVLVLLFGLRGQRLLEDYSCAIKDKILLHGRLYVTTELVCFYSNIFGHETRRVLPFSRVTSVNKTRNVLSPALEFTVQLKGGDTKRIVFTSFFSHYRDDAADLCLVLHRQHRPDLYPEPEAGSLSAAELRRSAKILNKGSVTAASGTGSAEGEDGSVKVHGQRKGDGFVSTADGTLYRQASEAPSGSDAGSAGEESDTAHGHRYRDRDRDRDRDGRRRILKSHEYPGTAGGFDTGRDRANTTAGIPVSELGCYPGWGSPPKSHKASGMRRHPHRPSMSSPVALVVAGEGEHGRGNTRQASTGTVVLLQHSPPASSHATQPSGGVGQDVTDDLAGAAGVRAGVEVGGVGGQGEDARGRVASDTGSGQGEVPERHDLDTVQSGDLFHSRSGSVVGVHDHEEQQQQQQQEREGEGTGRAAGRGGVRVSWGSSHSSSQADALFMPHALSDGDLAHMDAHQRVEDEGEGQHEGGAGSREVGGAHGPHVPSFGCMRARSASPPLRSHGQHRAGLAWDRSEYVTPALDRIVGVVEGETGGTGATGHGSDRVASPTGQGKGLTISPRSKMLKHSVSDGSLLRRSPPPTPTPQVSSPVVPAGPPAPPVPGDLWPRIARMTPLVDVVVPLSVAAFEDAFLGDAAVFSVGDAHKAWGDRDITQGDWADATGRGDAGSLASSSSGSSGSLDSSGSPDGRDGHGVHGDGQAAGEGSAGRAPGTPRNGRKPMHARVMTRNLRLIMPLKGAGPLVPAQTAVEKVQRLARYTMSIEGGEGKGTQEDKSGLLLVLDTSARSFDVPYGDYFVTEEAFLILPCEGKVQVGGHEGAPHAEVEAAMQARRAIDGAQAEDAQLLSSCCRVLIFVRVNFSKGTLFKGRIISETEKRTAAFADAYVARVREHMQKVLAAESRQSTIKAQPQPAVAVAAEAARPHSHSHPHAHSQADGHRAHGGQGRAASKGPPAPLHVHQGGAAAALLPSASPASQSRSTTPGSQESTHHPPTHPTHPPHPPGAPAHSGSSSQSSAPTEYLSPTAALAMADPTLAIPRDGVMQSFPSPHALRHRDETEVRRAYTQLYTAHAAAVAQVRTLQARTGTHAERRDRAGEHSDASDDARHRMPRTSPATSQLLFSTPSSAPRRPFTSPRSHPYASPRTSVRSHKSTARVEDDENEQGAGGRMHVDRPGVPRLAVLLIVCLTATTSLLLYLAFSGHGLVANRGGSGGPGYQGPQGQAALDALADLIAARLTARPPAP